MIIKSEDLKKYSWEEILTKREKIFQEKISYYKMKAQKAEEDYIAKMELFKKVYPILVTPVEELTDQQKIQLTRDFCSDYSIGHSRTQTKEFIEKYKDINKLTNQDIEHIQTNFYNRLAPKKDNSASALLYNTKNDIVFFSIDKNDVEDPKFLKKIENYCEGLLEQGLQVRLLINSSMLDKENESQADYLYSTETINNLIATNNRLQAKGMNKQICFYEFEEVDMEAQFNEAWELNDVIKANRKIDNIVFKIKENKLSPFEAMIYIHKYITANFQYTESGNAEHVEKSRVLPSIFSEGKIVCSGYASFVKAIIDKLDDPNLKCGLVSCDLYKRNKTYSLFGYHCHNLIDIKDEKYGINGVYVEDACWDSKRTGFKQGLGFAHCLYPIEDLQHFKKEYYYQKNAVDRMSSLFGEEKIRKRYLQSKVQNTKQKDITTLIKEYVERKKAVKDGADIIKEFGNNSSPIDIECYQKAIGVVLQKMKLCDQSNIKTAVAGMIKNSANVAQSHFGKNATSMFIKTKSAGKLKQQDSLEFDDGLSY